MEKAKIYLHYDESETGGERLSDEEYSSREPSYCEITNLRLSKDNSERFFFGESFEVDKEWLNEKGLYVVVVTYETGDSFGRCYGKKSFPHIYKYSSDGEKQKLIIQREYDEYKKTRNYITYRPWIGYFENLDSIEIEYVEFE